MSAGAGRLRGEVRGRGYQVAGQNFGMGAVGFFVGNTELNLELWTVISGISGFDD
ncbi:MAG: hypothetical protein VYB63_02040 [Chloroflexota bacterium]|nr:hypothetical protein [Chloroflexota bacterium]